MAVRGYTDRRGRQRYLVELQQDGERVFERLPPMATRGQAIALEGKRRREILNQGRLGQKPQLSLDDAIQLWLENTLAQKRDQKTPPQKAKLLAPFTKGKSLQQAPDAAREAISAWTRSCPVSTLSKVAGQRSATLSPATINRRLAVLKATCKYAWQQGWIGENLSGRIRMLPENNQRQVYLSAAQVRTLAKSSPTRECRAAIMIAAYTGLRVSELLSLGAVARRSATLSVSKSKSGKPRLVPVGGPALGYLSALPLGLSYDQLHKQFLVARKKAKMPTLHWHDLRHTTASLLVNSGADLYVVSQILGHSSMQTSKRYAHLSDASLKKAMRRLK